MRWWFGLLLGLLLVSPAFAQEEEPDPPSPPGKTFDVFGDEDAVDEDLPEGDAPEEEEPASPADEPGEVEVEEEEPPPDEPPSEDPVVEPPQEEPEQETEAPPPPPPSAPRLLVLLVGEQDDANQTERIGDAATRKLAAVRKLEPMTALEALDPTAEQTKREEIAIGRKTVDDGLIAFEELDLEAAGEKLDLAVNALAAYYGELPEPARHALSQAIFAHAATTLFEGLSDQADSIFVALAVLDPGFEPEEGRYPSNVVERFQGVKEGLASRPTGSLTVKTNPSGAAVYVDGLYRGASPVTVSNLADGYHVVSVRRVGFRPLGTMTPVNADSIATVDLELELSKDISRLQLFDRETFRTPHAAADLARAIGAKEIAVLDFARRLSGNVVEGVLVASDGTLLAKLPPTTIVEDPEVAGQTIADAFVRAEEEKRRLASLPPPSVETPLYEEWWFWAAVGGAVAVIATSAAVAAAVSSGGPPNNTAIFGF